MPCWRRCSAGPTPDSIRSWADPYTPAHRITSRLAVIVWRPSSVTTSTPVARPLSITTLVMSARVVIVRFGRP